MKKILILLTALFMYSCQKEFLAVKPLKSLLVPSELSDFQALLDNVSLMNINYMLNWAATDDFATSDAGWQAFSTPVEKNNYIWAKDIFEGGATGDWNQPYLQTLNANIVLDGLKQYHIKSSLETETVNILKGSALFYRSMAFFNLLQEFAAPYRSSTAKSDKGVPLRLLSDINIKLGRGNLEESYLQITSDLESSIVLLPLHTITNTRPTKAAALALLARTYLVMSNYDKALYYAEECLKLNGVLIDFNFASPNADATGNAEVIFNCGNGNYSFVNSTLSGPDTDLYALYNSNDLRKQYYFLVRANGSVGFRTMNAQNIGRFSGLMIDELYLIKAECLARLQKPGYGLETLNQLMEKRWAETDFNPYEAENATEALKIILMERRKELAYRGTRWTDLRRLNLEPEFAKTLTRTINGEQYTLLPNDKRYIYPIPQNEINASGIEQNER